MTDHYELFGVEPDASKDEIKAAYRSEVENADSTRRAELNRAWNVLSDPIQRQRYDEQRTTVDDVDEDDDGSVMVPARRATGARRGPDSAVLEANGSTSNGSGKNGSGGGGGKGGGGGGSGGGGDDGDDDSPRPRRPVLEPTVVLPAGMHLAEKKQRGMSIAFDLAIVIVIVLGCQFIVPRLVSSDFTKNQDIITNQIDKIERAQEREDNANDREDDAQTAARRAARNGNDAAEADARDDAAAARADARAAVADRKAAEKVRDDASGETSGPFAIASAVAFVLALLYCVPMSALTGQTVGKRIRKLWLVRTDGTKATWGNAFAHYVAPLAVGIAIPQLGAVIALAMVFWSLRDRNGQGLHDKLAKTLVVDSPPAT